MHSFLGTIPSFSLTSHFTFFIFRQNFLIKKQKIQILNIIECYNFRYISGSIHYFRIHPDYWEDRLHRIRAAGLNAVQVYVPWNYHEVYKGRLEFTDKNFCFSLQDDQRHNFFDRNCLDTISTSSVTLLAS